MPIVWTTKASDARGPRVAAGGVQQGQSEGGARADGGCEARWDRGVARG